MSKKPAGIASVSQVAASVASQMGYTVIDIELVKEPTGRFLRFYIDKDGGITLDDCEAFHRRVAPLCEDVDYDYMEVSSPGADRPLKKDADLKRALGQRVELHTYRPVNGVRIYFGSLSSFDDQSVVLLSDDARTMPFERKQIALIRLSFDFDESLLTEAEEE